ncbi:hypothetical protein C8T65DRAFT_614875 [Cerioporus squamosus]|nr:hypothetical protein C8T65DRAFT_614875 [Cerioporus squamosus]
MVASPVHPASLVDPSLHSPALMELVDMEMSRTLIEHVVDTVTETVDYALGRPSSSSRGRSMSRHSEHSKFLKFVTDVLHRAEVKVPALLVTLVYIERAKPHIQIALEQWAHERVFLGALILANKYLNDSTLKNVHWALCTGVFGKRDIGRIEREFLDVLDFELSVHEADLLAHHDTLLALSRPAHTHVATREHHKRHARRTSSPLGSRWSTDSSDMDVDSESSFESVSLPRTPEPIASTVPFPTKAELDFSANVSSHDDDAVHLAEPHHSHRHQSTHQRVRSSALSILRSFPMPFHHTSSHPHIATPAAQPYHHPLAVQAMPVRA